MGPPGGSKGSYPPSSSPYNQRPQDQNRQADRNTANQNFPLPQSSQQSDREPPYSYPANTSNVNQNFPIPQTVQRPGRISPYPVENDEHRLPVQDERGCDIVDGRPQHSNRTHVNVNVSYDTTTEEEVCQSTPDLVTSFIVNRMQNDGVDVPSGLSQRQSRVQRDLALTLQKIGDDMSNNRALNLLISEIRVTPNTAYATFVSVAAQIFQDGTINWGRIVTLFYFAYKLALQVVNQIPLVDIIIGWVTKFVAERLARWIAERGGWDSIREYFGAATQKFVAVFVAGILVSSLFWWWNKK